MSSFEPQGQQAAPGWYPVDGTSQRYWDGTQWTDNLAPLANPGNQTSNAVANVFGDDDKTYALIMHLGGLVVSFLVPLVMWLIKKDQSQFIDHHGKQILNFHMTMWIAGIVSFLLIFVLIGFLLLPIVGIVYVVFSILGAIAANKGEYYVYPVAIQFLK